MLLCVGFESNEKGSHPLCHRVAGGIRGDQWWVGSHHTTLASPTLLQLSWWPLCCAGMRNSCQILIFIDLKKALEGQTHFTVQGFHCMLASFTGPTHLSVACTWGEPGDDIVYMWDTLYVYQLFPVYTASNCISLALHVWAWEPYF